MAMSDEDRAALLKLARQSVAAAAGGGGADDLAGVLENLNGPAVVQRHEQLYSETARGHVP